MIVEIKVKTNSSKSEVILKDTYLIVKVHSLPQDGKANQEVIKTLSSYFDISKSKIKIIKGLKSKNKLIEVEK